jgi:hypothetical protein
VAVTLTNLPMSWMSYGSGASFDLLRSRLFGAAQICRRASCSVQWRIVLISRTTAQALEEIYVANPDPVSARLATHYEQAGDSVRAIPFYHRAAEVAQRVYAHAEAIGLLRHGLQLLHNVREQARREEQQLHLLRLLSLSLVATEGYGAPVVVDTLSEAQKLNQRLGNPPTPFSCGRSRSLLSMSVTSSKDLHLVISYLNWLTSKVIHFCWSKVIMYSV